MLARLLNIALITFTITTATDPKWKVNMELANTYENTLTYNQLALHLKQSVVTDEQPPGAENDKHNVPISKFKEYTQNKWPSGFPNGLYDFIVLKKYENEIRLLYLHEGNKLATTDVGHTSMMSKQEYKQYLDGKLYMVYAGEIYIKNNKVIWWSARSGHFKPDQNKFKVFGNYWNLPNNKFKDLYTRIEEEKDLKFNSGNIDLINNFNYNEWNGHFDYDIDTKDDANYLYLWAIVCVICVTVGLCIIAISIVKTTVKHMKPDKTKLYDSLINV